MTGLVVIQGVLADAEDEHGASLSVCVPLSGRQGTVRLGEVAMVGIVPRVTGIAVLEPQPRVLDVAEANTTTTSLCRDGPLGRRREADVLSVAKLAGRPRDHRRVSSAAHAVAVVNAVVAAVTTLGAVAATVLAQMNGLHAGRGLRECVRVDLVVS